ncbi:MAG: CapA family protein [Patescibacteria group bacterium]|nr:CapA family protein [Patescibacteria group bacterium]
MKKSLIIFIILFIIASVIFLCLVTRVKAPINNESSAVSVEQNAQNPSVEKSTSFVIAGDMMFDRFVNHQFKDIGFDHIFDNLDKSIFKEKDIVFANLEGPVSDKPIPDDYEPRTLVFDMPTATIPTLKNLGINGVSLANNHTLNAGTEGFNITQNLLKNTNIKYAGYQNAFDEGSILRYETEIPISFITVNYLAYNDNQSISEAIRIEKENGRFVIVFPHWGEEYSSTHSARQESAATKWIDAGADLIIGSHPHVIQDVGLYKNKLIIYSLGNFVFDQGFSEETQEGLMISGKITDKTVEVTFLPFKSKQLQPEFMQQAEKDAVLLTILSGTDNIGGTVTLDRN